MSNSPAQIKTLKLKGISSEEKSVPWSQQVDEASNEQFISLESNVQEILPTPNQIQESTWQSESKFRTIKYPDFQNIQLTTSHHFPNQETLGVKGENKMKSCNKISTKKDFSKPVLTEHHRAVLEKRSSELNDTKKTTWASIASQPIKSVLKGSTTMANHKKKGPGMPPPPMVPGKHNMDIVSWDFPKSNSLSVESYSLDKEVVERTIDNFSNFVVDTAINTKLSNKLQKAEQQNFSDKNSDINTKRNHVSNKLHHEHFSHCDETKCFFNSNQKADSCFAEDIKETVTEQAVINYPLAVDEFKGKNNYNPPKLCLEMATLARFFVIKSYSEDDIHRSIKYEIWCSTDHGNKRLDDAFRERIKKGGSVLLFFSVNGSGHFCGMAQMMTCVDYNTTASVWSQDKWKGKFKVKWIYVKDVPNGQLRHIKLENNDNKSVTNSRDTQEVPNSKGIQVLKIIHSYKYQTSIFDDFYHYERKQEEEISRHSNQNKMFCDYYKNKSISERNVLHADYYSGHKIMFSGEKDKTKSPEFDFNRECKGNTNKSMHRFTDCHQDKIIKCNRESDLGEVKEENRVGSCPQKSNKAR